MMAGSTITRSDLGFSNIRPTSTMKARLIMVRLSSCIVLTSRSTKFFSPFLLQGRRIFQPLLDLGPGGDPQPVARYEQKSYTHHQDNENCV